MNTFETDHADTAVRLPAVADAKTSSAAAARVRAAVPGARLSTGAGASVKASELKRAGMTSINTTGWPLAPQERMSG